MFEFEQDLLVSFNINLITHLQQDVLGSTEEDLTLLLLLETMFQNESVPLLGFPSYVRMDLKRFDRRSMWHGVFSKSFYA